MKLSGVILVAEERPWEGQVYRSILVSSIAGYGGAVKLGVNEDDWKANKLDTKLSPGKQVEFDWLLSSGFSRGAVEAVGRILSVK